jgi:competence protein ComEC
VAPALFPALAVLAGAVLGTFTELSFRAALGVLPVLCTAAALAWWRRAPLAACLATFCAFGLAAAILAADARARALHSPLRAALDRLAGNFLIDSADAENDHDPLPILAVLHEDASIYDDYVSLRAEVIAVQHGPEWRHASGGVTFSVNGEAGPVNADLWRAGRTIEAAATFRRPSRYLNDGVPDFERQLALDQTTLFGSIKSGLLVGVVAHGSWFQEWAGDVRAHVREAVRRWVAPHDDTAAAIVIAVLIGDRTGLSDAVAARLQRAGTYHIIAISGGNIAILAGLALGLLALVGGDGRLSALVTIVVLVVYATIATAGPSVWRATTMAVVYLSSRLLDHRTPPWQATTLAAAVMAVATPLEVRTAGFMLTFGATAALLESARRMRTFAAGSRLLAWFAASVAASIAVELALVPVSVSSFSRVTVAGPLLNLIAVPLMGVAQIAGLMVAAFKSWGVIAAPAGWVASLAASGIVESARLVDLAPAFTWRVPPSGIPLLIVYYGSLLGLLCLQQTRIRAYVATPVFVGALLAMIGIVRPITSDAVDGVRLTMFDVGQGEAMVLESGASRLQIDAGGAPFGGGGFDIGARVIAPALWARGIGRLDAVLLTHGDPDHIGGARVLLDDFGPRRLWEGVVVPRHEPTRELRQHARATGAIVEPRRAGESMQWGNVRIRVLHPPPPDWERPRVRNDDSVVLEVSCGDVALLLTGDISAETERQIAPQLTPARTRVLKVAHHGSRTSSSPVLLDGWRPQIALISAGRGNTFGHPTPEVIERLRSIGARVYRTDRDGEITLESDCKSVVVRTFAHAEDKPRRARRKQTPARARRRFVLIDPRRARRK